MNIEAILIGLFSVAHTPEQAQHAAREIMRLHAHELAEKIRKQRHESHDHVSCLPCFIYGEAASLISPEVLNSE